MHAEQLAGRDEVAHRPERVAAQEHLLLRPPQRDLAPEAVPHDRDRVERRAGDALEGRLVERDAEPPGERGAVAPVPVEELDHAGRLAEGADPLIHSWRVDRIEDPDAALGAERMR